MTRKPGSFVTLKFTGRSFGLLYTSESNCGKIDVYVDNRLVAILNEKASQIYYQKRWDYSGKLPAGTHKLRLVFMGPADSKVTLDAVIVR